MSVLKGSKPIPCWIHPTETPVPVAQDMLCQGDRKQSSEGQAFSREERGGFEGREGEGK